MLPELDDDFAVDAAGFDTLAELREDLRARLLEADESAVEREFRDAVLDAAADAATIAAITASARSERSALGSAAASTSSSLEPLICR